MAFFASPVLSQAKTKDNTPPTSVCETDGRFGDFDFWVGEWKVYSNDEGRSFQGSNAITRHHNGCLLMENWTSAKGTTGSSMNYYDTVTKKWRQLWIADAYSIDYTGGLDATGSMVLKGKIHYFKNRRSESFRGRWTPNKDGTIRQLFEQQDEETGMWKVWFDGVYVRK